LAEQSASGLPRTLSDKYLSGWVLKQRKLYAAKTLGKDKQAKLEGLKGWNWSNDFKSQQWKAMYAHLEQFVEKNGHARVKDKLVVDGVKLGTWVAVQRRRYVDKTITKSQVVALQKLPQWSWNPIEDDWNDSYQQFVRFVNKSNGTTPRAHIPEETELAQWVGVQRSVFKARKMKLDRIKKLSQTKHWSWDPVDDLWNQRYKETIDFAKKHKRLPTKAVPSERILGNWVQTQRRRRRKGVMSREQTQLLQQIENWTWHPFVEIWESSIAALRDFVRREGHARVPSEHLENGLNLGSWVNGVRTRHNRGSLSSGRVKELEAIPGWTWNQLEEQWQKNFMILKRFVLRYGPQAVKDNLMYEGVPIGKWVGKQRARHKRKSLDLKKQKQLESLPGWLWDASHLKSGLTKSEPNGRRNQ
jgi:hypothetical protein